MHVCILFYVKTRTSSFLKVVQHTEGMLRSIIWILLGIYFSFQQWKNFENPLRTDKVSVKSLVYYFLGHSVYSAPRCNRFSSIVILFWPVTLIATNRWFDMHDPVFEITSPFRQPNHGQSLSLLHTRLVSIPFHKLHFHLFYRTSLLLSRAGKLSRYVSRSTQPGHPSMGRSIEYQLRLER